MDHLRCPQLERLGGELIEAYRLADDRDVFCLSEDLNSPSNVAALHHVMAEHRKSCPICREVARAVHGGAMIEMDSIS